MLKRNSTYVLELTFHSGRAYEGISYGRGVQVPPKILGSVAQLDSASDF